jgi:magnesium-transporting ATPase (P-type)
MDYSMKNGWEMLSFYLLMALPSVELGFYEYGFKEERDEITAEKKQFHYSVWMALSALLTVLFFFIAYLVNRDFLVESGVAYLPADFLKSIPFGPVFLFSAVLVAPLVAFFHFFPRSKKKDGTSETAE